MKLGLILVAPSFRVEQAISHPTICGVGKLLCVSVPGALCKWQKLVLTVTVLTAP